MIISEIVKLFKRKTGFDKKAKIYKNGEDNAYPESVERLINNSVTAKRGAHIIKSMIMGKGFDSQNDFIVNQDKNISLFQLLNTISDCYAKQDGFFIHANYFLDGKIKNLDVLPYNHCRVGKKDDNDYNGKIVVKDWEDKKDEPNVIDVYNSLPKVIQAQIAKQGINKYKGQVLFVNPSGYTYPLSRIDPVMNDADSESQVSVYKNISLRKGFFGKQLVITEPFTDGDASEEEQKTEEYQRGETERSNFRKNLKDFVGAENAEGIMHLEMELVGEDFEKTILFKTIDSNINDKLFAHTESSISGNISVAYSIPEALIRPNKGALFAQSGEAIHQMKLFVQEETSFERKLIEITINQLLKNFKDYDGGDLKIVELIKKQENVNNKN